MHFDLTKPCGNCPFRSDCLKGWLGECRATEIADALESGHTFQCHKTSREGGAKKGVTPQHCAGALIVCEKAGIPPGQLARIAGRLGVFNPDALDVTAPVFDDLNEFVAHHTTEGATNDD